MILKGGSRTGSNTYARYLARHVQRTDTNESVAILGIRGTAADSPRGALEEMAAYGLGADCRRPLYHLTIDPDPADPQLTPAQEMRAIECAEEHLGFAQQPRLVVRHVKEGRLHLHAVWSRIDLDRMRPIPDGWNYVKHEEIARTLEREFSHRHVEGAFVDRDGRERPSRRPSDAEVRQGERTGIAPHEARVFAATAWEAASDASAFTEALEVMGWSLARGDKRIFVAVDPQGGVHSLARLVQVKTADIRAYMRAIDLDALPSVDEARLECKRRQAIIIQHATVREVAVEVTQPSVIPGAVRRSAAADSDLPGVKILDCKVEKPALDPIAAAEIYHLQAAAQSMVNLDAEMVTPEPKHLVGSSRVAPVFNAGRAEVSPLVSQRETPDRGSLPTIPEPDRIGPDDSDHQIPPQVRAAGAPQTPERLSLGQVVSPRLKRAGSKLKKATIAAWGKTADRVEQGVESLVWETRQFAADVGEEIAAAKAANRKREAEKQREEHEARILSQLVKLHPELKPFELVHYVDIFTDDPTMLAVLEAGRTPLNFAPPRSTSAKPAVSNSSAGADQPEQALAAARPNRQMTAGRAPKKRKITRDSPERD